MKQFSIFLSAFCVTLLAAAAIAQTTEPPVSTNASRRQSGTVGPPLDAASMNQPAASSTRPAAQTVSPAVPAPAATQTPAPAPEVDSPDTSSPVTTAPAETAKPATGSRASRRASGRVTEADGSSGGLPVRPDRN
ncbi:hypothetical protein [Mitsuaria sp. 7]|uniref:hypothetical protein n=1 Tax=Mitsuaria sp. 7 TaxID=1658665 RepID=UPI0007DDDC0C|nr:hypothetical protein [Mitsuaria sp. 7]ANH67695.1 hypothetical protein ABE85_09165 [Mitsuaria sp. 7]